MDCLFGFLLLALLMFLYNHYLKMQREGITASDVQNATINKKKVLRNTATLEMIKDKLNKNMLKFSGFEQNVLKNKQDNKNNEMLLETTVKKNEEEMNKEAVRREKIGEGL